MSDVISVDFKQNAARPAPLLVSRKQTCAMLGGISASHLRRLMKAGELEPVFLNPSAQPRRRGKLFFRTSDLEALVEKYAKRSAP
ncbi:hypothetical protein ACH79_16440 [Bradyrhizobium sp. CCBAU 051011]|uniref:helix-turn-helix transcriptional regulator n=1 Tax=Bradyrhizobium sp. CCBAU 051011 TaxID=858422 RepID=UPI0013744A17|nr:helix-turn-helix domain-containing protein [Bradyrhizobium sp. CCBAU 051011]QHO73983.1 hypothetical protein ACH79_16440 [Bradyrhizobium sp. CCBAU 051011]